MYHQLCISTSGKALRSKLHIDQIIFFISALNFSGDYSLMPQTIHNITDPNYSAPTSEQSSHGVDKCVNGQRIHTESFWQIRWVAIVEFLDSNTPIDA